MTADPRLITALDLPSTGAAQKLVNAIGDACCFYKIGLQLFPLAGMALCRELRAAGHGVFWTSSCTTFPRQWRRRPAPSRLLARTI